MPIIMKQFPKSNDTKKNKKAGNDKKKQYKKHNDNDPKQPPPSDNCSTDSEDEQTKKQASDRVAFTKMLASLFPSKHAMEKVKYEEQKAKNARDTNDKNDKNDNSDKNDKNDNSGDETDVDSDDDVIGTIPLKNGMKMTNKAAKELQKGIFNIIIAIDPKKKNKNEDDEDYEDYEDESQEDDEDDDDDDAETIHSSDTEEDDDEDMDDEDEDEDTDDSDETWNPECDNNEDDEEDEDEADEDHEDEDDEDDDDDDDKPMIKTRNQKRKSSKKSDKSCSASASKQKTKNSCCGSKRQRCDNKQSSISCSSPNKQECVFQNPEKLNISDLIALFDEEKQQIESAKKALSALLDSDPKNTVAKRSLIKLVAQEERLKERRTNALKKVKKTNIRTFRKLLLRKNSTNDLKYFVEQLSLEKQNQIINEYEKVHKISLIEKPYRLTLLESNIPTKYKAIALRKISTLSQMEPGCGEYYKIKNWVDTFMKIPFNNLKQLPITMNDGIEKCSGFMNNAKQILDSAVYGMTDAKLQVMQMLGQWISNPDAMGTAIAIHGKPGCGKTSLVKDGISKILGRDFAFIALGGATDSSFLEGHSYTYEGSTWGKIVDILIHCNSMNPVIYFDELDKISETAKGEEIAGILTHLTDTSQNASFHDKYFAEIDFDLSKCLFIFSYNDASRVNPILLDRMYRIEANGYSKKDKTQIAQNYLIPKICKEVGFATGDIVISDEVIEYIVEHMTDGEEGVRNLKRCLEIIHTKLNLFRLISNGKEMFDKEMNMIVEFPYTVSIENVGKLIKKVESKFHSAPMSLYI